MNSMKFLLMMLMAAPAGAAKGPKPVLDLYVMSLCPFGVQAENAVIPAVKSLDGAADLKLYFIGNDNPGPDGKPVFTALHGQPEVDENIRQVCALKTQPKKALDYIMERNKEYRKPEWKPAAEAVGLDVKKIEDCFASEEGRAAYAASLKASRERKASGSPTIYIDGELYQGARGQKSFTQALCKALAGKGFKEPAGCAKAASLPDDPAPAGNCGPTGAAAPAAQAGAPAPISPVFDIKIVTERSCSFCQPHLVEGLKAKHTGAKVTVLDAETKEGKELLSKHAAESLPLYVLDKKAEQERNFPELLSQFYARSADGYVVRPTPSTYIPVVQLGRKRQPRHLDLFLESLSWRSAQGASEILRYLAEKAPDDVTFSVHFVVQEAADLDPKAEPASAGKTRVLKASAKPKAASAPRFTSAQGEAEVLEDLRQICLFQRADMRQFLTYLDCRGQNLQDNRRAVSCLNASDVLTKCMNEGEGAGLLRQDAQLARDLRISGAPMILWENRYGPFRPHEVDWRAMISDKK